MFFYGKQLALESFDTQNRPITKDLDPIFDFNFNVKYNYSKRLGAFLKMNNILNTKHIRWDQYSNYGLNFLFGVGYSF
jgi:outer membrane receptor protein involved in Fe transport